MSPKHWLDKATSILSQAGIESARLDAQILIEDALGRDRASLSIDDSSDIDTPVLSELNQKLERRAKREPLAYIRSFVEFYGSNIGVNKSVLIPRPETETLVEFAIKNTEPKSKVLELGTGSGAISIVLKKNRNDISIVATDVSNDALKLAKKNAQIDEVEIAFVHSDLFENIAGTFDVILANLPYVPSVARRQPEITHEPDIALYSGEDGLELYNVFFAQLEQHLSDSGFAVVEFSPTQFSELRSKFNNLVFEPLSEYIYLARSKKIV